MGCAPSQPVAAPKTGQEVTYEPLPYGIGGANVGTKQQTQKYGSAGAGAGSPTPAAASAAATSWLDRLMTYAVNELRNSLHALDASATSVWETASASAAAAETGQANMGQAGVVAARELVSDMSDILFAARNTGILVGDILTLTKLRDGSFVTSPEPLCPKQLLRDALVAMKPVSRVPLHLSVSPNVPDAVVVDGGVLTQVLSNALAGSVKHTQGEEGVFITLSRLTPEGEAAMLRAGAVTASGLAGVNGAGARSAMDGGFTSDATAAGPVSRLPSSTPLPGSATANGPASSSSSSSGSAAGSASAAVPSHYRRLLIEVLDRGRPLGIAPVAGGKAAGSGGSSSITETLATALARGVQVRGARAQRIALLLPVVRQLLDAMGGGAVLVDEVPEPSGTFPGGSVISRFALSVPYGDPTPAEASAVLALLQQDEATAQAQAVRVSDQLPPPPFGRVSGATGMTLSQPLSPAAVAAARLTLPPEPAALSTSEPPRPAPMMVAQASASSASGEVGILTPEGASLMSPQSAAPGAPVAVGGPGGGGAKAAASGGAGSGRSVVGLDGVPLRMHVLLVDDVRLIRRQGEAFLEQLGCTCKTLEDGDQVERALEQSGRPFDAILMDIVMSRSDGAQVCQRLRQKQGARCPIIAMTGNTSTRDNQRYYAMGFDVVMPKPFTRDSLGRALVEARERRGGNTRLARLPAKTGIGGSAAGDAAGSGDLGSGAAGSASGDFTAADLGSGDGSGDGGLMGNGDGSSLPVYTASGAASTLGQPSSLASATTVLQPAVMDFNGPLDVTQLPGARPPSASALLQGAGAAGTDGTGGAGTSVIGNSSINRIRPL